MIPFFEAVGVDLGTTFSVVGASINGKVVIMQDQAGHKIFPSIVSYQDNGGMKVLVDKSFSFLATFLQRY